MGRSSDGVRPAGCGWTALHSSNALRGSGIVVLAVHFPIQERFTPLRKHGCMIAAAVVAALQLAFDCALRIVREIHALRLAKLAEIDIRHRGELAGAVRDAAREERSGDGGYKRQRNTGKKSLGHDLAFRLIVSTKPNSGDENLIPKYLICHA
jgi:hypothetical protein